MSGDDENMCEVIRQKRQKVILLLAAWTNCLKLHLENLFSRCNFCAVFPHRSCDAGF